MAVGIYLGGKDEVIQGDNVFYALSFYVADSADTATPIPAKFIQTESLTEAFIGITEYGAMYLNDLNTDDTDTVTVTAVRLDTGAEVEAEVGVSDIIALVVGAQLGGV